jgi:hypothetical protein
MLRTIVSSVSASPNGARRSIFHRRAKRIIAPSRVISTIDRANRSRFIRR